MVKIGKTLVEKLTYFAPSAACYGTTAGIGLLYFTDWKLFLQYVPIYNGKFKTTE